MKKFLVVLCLIVIGISGGYLYYYFSKPNGDTNVSAEGEKYYLSWNAYPEATEYNVYIDNQLIKTVTTNKAEITEYLVDDKTYSVQVKTFSVEDGEVVVYTEEYEYKATTQSDFERKTFFMNGAVYDYNIESLKEYEIFVWYNILYRNNAARFYNSCKNINVANVNRLTYDYIVSYPEYDGVQSKSQYAAKLSNTIYTLKNFEYYLPNNFTLSTANCTNKDNSGLYNYKQDKTQATKATLYNMPYEAAETSSARNFPIDEEDVLKVKVYNTEQLFMVVQYGASPVFPEANSVAETVYNNAKDVLEQINNADSLSDYQKALNIYRYICMNVKYDNILFDYMEETNNSSVMTFGKFSPFYLEGVFYDMDNQVAVCDGLSKAFALMCRIEGIEATKVNGLASGGNHAWNKVKIGSNYHLVDTTWGTASFTHSGELQEALSHAYFLVGEDSLTTHEASFQVPTATTVDYNYYANTTIDGISTYITSTSQYTSLRDKVLSNEDYFFEIEFSQTLAAQLTTEYGSVESFLRSCATSIYGSVNSYVTLSDTRFLIQVTPTKSL